MHKKKYSTLGYQGEPVASYMYIYIRHEWVYTCGGNEGAIL